eukprot:Filipodium_phascolosomae@DN3941_c0_g1_i1.p1
MSALNPIPFCPRGGGETGGAGAGPREAGDSNAAAAVKSRQGVGVVAAQWHCAYTPRQQLLRQLGQAAVTSPSALPPNTAPVPPPGPQSPLDYYHDQNITANTSSTTTAYSSNWTIRGAESVPAPLAAPHCRPEQEAAVVAMAEVTYPYQEDTYQMFNQSLNRQYSGILEGQEATSILVHSAAQWDRGCMSEQSTAPPPTDWRIQRQLAHEAVLKKRKIIHPSTDPSTEGRRDWQCYRNSFKKAFAEVIRAELQLEERHTEDCSNCNFPS